MSQTTSLNVLKVQSPCPQSWEEMKGDEQQRFCEGCQLHVHNLSAMPREKAERLVCESAGRLCVRFERDASGQVVTLDYKPAAKRFGGWRTWSALGMLLAVAGGTAQKIFTGKAANPIANNTVVGALPIRLPPPPTTGFVMGKITAPPPPAPPPVPPAVEDGTSDDLD